MPKPDELRKMQPAWQTAVADMLERDDQRQPTLPSECFLRPVGPRLVVQEDEPKSPSRIIHIPKNRIARPTIGRVIAASDEPDLQHWLGKRVLYAQMSGTGINFKNRPAWRVLVIEEVLAEVTVEDAEIEEPSSPDVFA